MRSWIAGLLLVAGCYTGTEAGANGKSGAPGADGQQGVEGPQGPQGPKGPAGDPGPAGADGRAAESGSRLKATYRVGDDGSKAYDPYTWYDTYKQIKCSFIMASDGVERCLPPIYQIPTTTSGYYGDSACSVAVVAVGSCQAPAFAYEAVTLSSCLGGYKIYSVGAPASPVYTKSGSTCAVTSTTYATYSLGPEVPATDFVGSTTGHD